MAKPVPLAVYMPDVSDLNAAGSKQILNVLPRSDGYTPFKDWVGFATALPGPCRGYFYAHKSDNSILVFAATSTRIYLMNNTTLAWVDVSKGGSGGAGYAALSAESQWQFAQFNNFVIAVQANVPPQVYDMSSSTVFADLAGTPPQAAYIAVVNRFVVLSGLLSFPYRIQWSALNDVTGWTPALDYSDYQDFPDGGVVRGVVGGEMGLIAQDSALRRMIYSPGSDIVFQIDRLAKDRGVLAPYSMITSGERMFMLSPQGFIKVDASGAITPIGAQRIDETFFADYDSSHPELMIGVSDPIANQVLFPYKSKSGIAGVFDKILCYNWLLDKWTLVLMVGQYMATIAKPGMTLESLDSISMSIDALPFSLDSVSTQTLPSISTVNASNTVGFFTGVNLEATMDIGEQSAHDSRLIINGLYPITDAVDVYADIAMRESMDINAVVTMAGESAREFDGRCPFLVDARFARGKIRIPYGTNWTFASGLIPDIQQGGL
jgi:hypothetical protein